MMKAACAARQENSFYWNKKIILFDWQKLLEWKGIFMGAYFSKNLVLLIGCGYFIINLITICPIRINEIYLIRIYFVFFERARK